MSKILIVAEHLDGKLNSSTARCVTCARELKAESIDVLVLAADVSGVAAEAAKIDGVSRVLTVSRAENAHALAAVLAPQIAAAAKTGYSHVLAPSTTFGKDVLPRVAALLGVAQVSDVSAVEGSHAFKRPIYAGNAIITVQAPADQILVATVRTASYAAAASGSATATVEAISLDVALPWPHTVRRAQPRQERSPGPAKRRARGFRWPRAGFIGKLRDHLRAGRQAGRSRGCFTRRGGCRLCAE
jgi:electron transfer flavoprotein alpha subunit